MSPQQNRSSRRDDYGTSERRRDSHHGQSDYIHYGYSSRSPSQHGSHGYSDPNVRYESPPPMPEALPSARGSHYVQSDHTYSPSEYNSTRTYQAHAHDPRYQVPQNTPSYVPPSRSYSNTYPLHPGSHPMSPEYTHPHPVRGFPYPLPASPIPTHQYPSANRPQPQPSYDAPQNQSSSSRRRHKSSSKAPRDDERDAPTQRRKAKRRDDDSRHQSEYDIVEGKSSRRGKEFAKSKSGDPHPDVDPPRRGASMSGTKKAFNVTKQEEGEVWAKLKRGKAKVEERLEEAEMAYEEELYSTYDEEPQPQQQHENLETSRPQSHPPSPKQKAPRMSEKKPGRSSGSRLAQKGT